MKKVRDYILKGQDIFIGLEDSKKKWVLCARSYGRIVHETTMPADYDNLRNYFNNRFPDCKINVIYEAGFRGFGLHDDLEDDGWNCVVTPPHRVTEEKCNRKKNDRRDCRRLAKNLENNDYKSCYVPDAELREDRQLSRVLGQVNSDLVRARNRIRRSLEFHGLDANFPSGCWGERMYRGLGAELRRLKIRPTLYRSFELLLIQLEHLRQMKKEVLKELRELSKSQRYKEQVKILRSAPGVGPLTAIRLALEWGDMKGRFKRKEEFGSYLGLIPSEYSTGELDRKGHITKEGNRAVRAWLMESSWVAIRYDGVLMEKFITIQKRTGSKKKAIVAVARKLALRLRTILLKQELYQLGVVV
jgi:transposase